MKSVEWNTQTHTYTPKHKFDFIYIDKHKNITTVIINKRRKKEKIENNASLLTHDATQLPIVAIFSS